MIKEYIEKNIDTLDRNGDGVIGYVLAIGDVGHNDSIARTRGVRKALGTAVEKDGEIVSDPAGINNDGKSKSVQDGSLEINGKTYTVRELASQEMKNSSGATWDAATAGNTIGTWTASFGDEVDVVASNNMVWVCQCSMLGQKKTKFLHSDTMLTQMQLLQSLKDMVEQFLNMLTFKLI